MLESLFDNRYKVAEKRLAICNSCDEYDQKWKKCKKCGCFMEFKSLLPSAKCPLDKWKIINTESTERDSDE
jgi:hypothetical protein